MLLGEPQRQESPVPTEAPDTYVSRSEKEDNNDTDTKRSERAHVKRWQKLVRDAKSKWDKDFTRMRENMDFVAGLQWSGQKNINHDQYVANFTLRTINNRVASLYARDPKVAATRRRRLDFQLWDGNVETLQQAVMQAMQAQMTGMPVPPQSMALFNDFQMGRERQKLVDRVGQTLELAYQYQQDTLEPRFKTQMKQAVRRASVCGVGYVKVSFVRDYENELTHSETRVSVVDRARQAKRIVEQVQEGKVQPTDEEFQTLKELLESLDVPPLDAEAAKPAERLVFNFPQATAIIPDENCRMLRGFVGARWIAEEFRYSLEFVNSFFEKDIKPQADLKQFGPDGKPIETILTAQDKMEQSKSKVILWQIYDMDTKSTFIICDGYKDYIQEPEPLVPSVKSFWNVFPIMFNDIEVVEGCEASIFPPSDVDLIKSAQREHNRCRESDRRHRKANRPRYMYPKGALKKEDLDAITNADDEELIPLSGLQPGVEPGKVLQPIQHDAYEPDLYDTTRLHEDALLTTGQQEANMGPAQPNVTATVGTIAEQSRISVASSDIDGLDDTLSDVASCGGEMLLREMSVETVRRIVGVGAVWPQENKEDFINEVELEIVAASSGKPNKAIEMANLERVVPLIMQAATLPPQAQPTIQAIIREIVKVMDSRLEPADFFPIPMPLVPPTAGGSEQSMGQQGNNPGIGRPVQKQKPRQLSEGNVVPLAGQPQNT